jgi:hypothetical protein
LRTSAALGITNVEVAGTIELCCVEVLLGVASNATALPFAAMGDITVREFTIFINQMLFQKASEIFHFFDIFNQDFANQPLPYP